MSLDDATRIVARLGPCTLSIDRVAHPELARHLALLGCVIQTPGGGASVAVVGDDEPPGDGQTLVVVSEHRHRDRIETPLLATGWRRHPGGMLAADIAGWTAERVPRLNFYCRAGDSLFARGAEADAPIARFATVADLVRSGDAVLVGGRDAAEGGAILAACSRAAAIVTAALSDLTTTLAATPARSFDTIVLVADPAALDAALLDEAGRALKVDGRIMLGWRGDGTAVEATAAEHFIVDRRFRQGDGGALLVASADPFGADETPYRHPAFHRGDGALPTLVDFGPAYDNPHLYRTMVQLGERVGDDMTLARLAETVLAEAGAASADRGAAITVLGYRVLDLGLTGSVEAVSGLIDTYLVASEGSNAPHVLRWRLSLLFLAGRLAELAGRPGEAIERFRAASLADWVGFSPILATKAVAAAFHEARLLIASGERGAAMACFRRGLDTALAAAAAPHGRDATLPFYLTEMAEVMDMGGQCAVALANAHLLDRDPGLFWRQVDTKRFGLFAWADGLAREQAKHHAG